MIHPFKIDNKTDLICLLLQYGYQIYESPTEYLLYLLSKGEVEKVTEESENTSVIGI